MIGSVRQRLILKKTKSSEEKISIHQELERGYLKTRFIRNGLASRDHFYGSTEKVSCIDVSVVLTVLVGSGKSMLT